MRPFIDKYLQVCYYENNQKIKRFMNNILKIDWFRPGKTIEELKNKYQKSMVSTRKEKL